MKRPFDILRAVFWLVAIVIILEMISTIIAGTLCWIINWHYTQTPGACRDVGETIRDVWNEAITAVMALLIAAARLPPPDKGNEDEH